ncbi:MAG: four-carbon acid sugar kinase family protein [Pseudomonadota bacterium]
MTAPWLTFYGDDFTGSSAVMEVLSFAGINTMLFLGLPDAATLARHPDLQAVGVAGTARSQSPAWMKATLPGIFKGLNRLGAPLLHYKVCSTFDSSPEVGSIGVAADIGRDVLKPAWIPLVVGAPDIGRYQVFGNLFATAGDAVHRLDRHPVMSRHPVTPMAEADLLLHLSRQTAQASGVVDVRSMGAGHADRALADAVADGCSIVALDALDSASLECAGRLIDETRPGFAIGSQGVEYALVAHWRATGRIPNEGRSSALHPVDQLFAVTGSCAQTTANQIAFAEAKGFAVLDFDATMVVETQALASETERLADMSLKLLSEGRSVLVTTARGPDDPAVTRMREAVAQSGINLSDANLRLGSALGHLVRVIRTKTGIKRVAIGGGDTSGHALTALEADALSAIAPLAPGAPLCCVHARHGADIDGLEITLKGGQMGAPDFFVKARNGAA